MTTVAIKLVRRILISGAAVSLAVILLSVAGIFLSLENKSYDQRVRDMPDIMQKIAPTSDAFIPSDDIILVCINQESLAWAQETLGWSWPWPRAAYAQYLDFLAQGNPASCVFDIMYTESSAYGAADDAVFAESLKSFEKAVLPVFFTSSDGISNSWDNHDCGTSFTLNGFDPLINKYDVSAQQMQALFPIPELSMGAGQLGNVTSILPPDGVIRSASLFYQFQGVNVPSLSSACLCRESPSSELTYDSKKSIISWNDSVIPVDHDGTTLLRFKGEIAKYIPYSIKDILESSIAIENGDEPFLYPEDFEGKYVFTFLYGPGLYDICTTPINAAYPGAGVHITMLDNLLKNDFISRSPQWVDFMLIVSVSFFVVAITLLASKIWISTIALLLTSATIIVSSFGFYVAGWWIPEIPPIFAAFIAYFVAVMLKYFTEGKQKRYIKAAFKQYLSPAVIEQLIEYPDRLKLGGERREISIFFSDIQGFTTISEKLDPEQLTEFLNTYLSCMSDIILQSGGTIDKYEGDAIIAFWNAPATQGNHAERALSAALQCHRIEQQMQEQFMTVTGKPVHTRIGLNTGYAVVGNMGSRDRFDYTMIGDSVNLAARLEGLNKQFGTYLMCSESLLSAAMKTAAADTFHARILASVAVVGRSDPVTVYEPVQNNVWDKQRPIAGIFEQGYNLFYSGKFAEAKKIFESIAADDEPANRYLQQCDYYLVNPGEWPGYWVARTK